ncbi:hypothetical protein FOA43_004616 [Brettanomyces nanus]|uniref:RIC1 C-terminal alpha solenoid region domain-containing protein n=1 Tax=Eeniella nana TaxID=13502 RepID=A0A875SCN1_EENNA|nr:uncharacterized protein FOA43_004616 [Brettanomyces nanus]QPG77209.1 hypothetical protein FOA43_004616 [Brettanomyces nanus]
MLLPSCVSAIHKLPEITDLETLYRASANPSDLSSAYQPSPHEDAIIGSMTVPTVTVGETHRKLPYCILTYRSLYLFDSHTGSPISAHVRSDSSVSKYGSNVKVKMSPNGKILAIETSANVVLVYTIRTDLIDDELLTIYNSEGFILQNGFPSPRYQEKSTYSTSSAGTTGTTGTTGTSGINLKADAVNGMMKTFLSVFNDDSCQESPVIDYGLRLRMILNVQSRLSEYCFLNDARILLVNSKPRALQVVKLDGSEKEEEYLMMESLDWYQDNKPDILEIVWDDKMRCGVWISSSGKCWLVKESKQEKTPDSTQSLITNNDTSSPLLSHFTLALKGIPVYSSLISPASHCLLSHSKNLCYVGLTDGSLLIFKLLPDFSVGLLKTIRKPPNAGSLLNISLSPLSDSIVAHYNNGWVIYSCLGNLNFSTFEYDQLKFTIVNDIRFIDSFHMLLTTSDEMIWISLACLNYTSCNMSGSIKRPVLISDDHLSIFKAYDKKLIDMHHYNYRVSDTTGKETNIWLSQSIPLSFRLRNTQIRSCCVSDDGCNVCLVGNVDVAVFSITLQRWRFLERPDNAPTSTSAKALAEATPVVGCMWWKGNLILGSRTREKSELAAFGSELFDTDHPFVYDNAMWYFDFAETRFENERFLNFNLDSFKDELIVITDQLNVYTWKLSSKGHSVVFSRSKVYQLKGCFDSNNQSETVRLNFGSIANVGDTDLLILANTDLFYICKVRGTQTSAVYEARLISNCVEYVEKLSAGLVTVFDGSQMLHYNVGKGQDMTLVEPIKIKIGNDISYDKNGHYVINSAGTTAYPVTTLPAKNIIFGVEADCISDSKIRLETSKRNYLDDLVNHYIIRNINVANTEDPNALGLSVVYRKLCRYGQFKFVLEILMVNYMQKVYEHKNYDNGNEYFDRLMELINMTGKQYEILLNCLKKTESQYWEGLFGKLKETPRQIMKKLYEEEDYRLCAHYFTIMLTSGAEVDKKKDHEFIGQILMRLVMGKDYETTFEMVRFIKLIDEKWCHEVVETLRALPTI